MDLHLVMALEKKTCFDDNQMVQVAGHAEWTEVQTRSVV